MRGHTSRPLHCSEESEAVRRKTRTGRMWGGEAFVAGIGGRSGRLVCARPVGQRWKPSMSERARGNKVPVPWTTADHYWQILNGVGLCSGHVDTWALEC